MTPLERRSLMLAVTGWCGFGAGGLVLQLRLFGAGGETFAALCAIALLCLITFAAAIVCAVKSRRQSPATYKRDYRSPISGVALWLAWVGLVLLLAPFVTLVVAILLFGGSGGSFC